MRSRVVRIHLWLALTLGLAWAVQGCLNWQKAGRLIPPEKVLAATAEYKEESDRLHDFIQEACVKGKKQHALFGSLFRGYTEWCQNNGERPLGKTTFKAALVERGYHVANGTGNSLTVYSLALAPTITKNARSGGLDDGVFLNPDDISWGDN